MHFQITPESMRKLKPKFDYSEINEKVSTLNQNVSATTKDLGCT